jgi:hypothetical protein
MSKYIVVIILLAGFLSFGIKMKTAGSEEGQAEDRYVDLTRLEEKIDTLSRLIKEKDDAEIYRKLDQIVNNQNKIINELEVVKIRATRR